VKELRTFLNEDGTRRYRVAVPDFIADREDFPHWEKDRLLSMDMNLAPRDVLFDVGAELGWQSAIYAGFVAPCHIHLFEPAAELWPTIRAIWDANHLPVPGATCAALVSNRTWGEPVIARWGWPDVAYRPALTGYDNWAAIHSYGLTGVLPEISLDEFVARTGVVPTAIAVDVEGAEGRVLRGAARILREHRPRVWVSLHPDVRLAKYGTSKDAIRKFVCGFDYDEQYLGTDHEEHWFFYPRERRGDVVLVDSPWMTHGRRDARFEEVIPGWRDPWDAERATWGAD
jgi:FkbM family methyltransferase